MQANVETYLKLKMSASRLDGIAGPFCSTAEIIAEIKGMTAPRDKEELRTR
jgi:hypothetical protein